MQKNVPKYTPDWITTTPVWSAASKREIAYALCNDRRTLLWFANQRAVEFHPTLFRIPQTDAPTHLVLDLDPPEGRDFRSVVAAAELVRHALAEVGLAGAVKTSGSKGAHIFVPVIGASTEEVALATRALAVRAEALDPDLATTAFIKADREGKVFLDSTRAGGGSVAAVYSPRLRPGTPVSFPVAWSDLADVTPADFTLHTAPALLGDADPVDGADAGCAAGAGRAGRAGPHHPGRPGPSAARGAASAPPRGRALMRSPRMAGRSTGRPR